MFLRIIFAAALAAGLASAQRGGGGGGRNGGNDMNNMNTPRRGQTRLDQIADKLNLSKDQKEEFQNILSATAEKAGPLNEQLRNGRQEIAGVIVNGRDSGDDWDKLKAAYTEVLAQQAGLEAQAYQKLYAILKDKQKTKAAPVFEELMAGLFERTGGGGGGRTR